MKKALSLLLCILLSLTNISVFAEEVDYCELYGVGCPGQVRPEEEYYSTLEITFNDYIAFRNAKPDGDQVEFVVRGKNWNNDKDMNLTLLLIPHNKKYNNITQDMTKKVIKVKTRESDYSILETEHEAKTIVDIPINNSNENIEYTVKILRDGEEIIQSDNIFVIAGMEQQEAVESPENYEWSNSGINVAVNGENIVFPDQKPLLETNTSRTYVPVRFLAENLGAEVEWDNDNQVVIIKNKFIEGANTKRLHYLKIEENKFVSVLYSDDMQAIKKIYVFELPKEIKPTLVNGRTMLPFRYVAELLGSQVYYNENTSTAHCIKRDMSIYNGEAQVMSTLISEYFTDELKNYRRIRYGSEIHEKTGKSVIDIEYNGDLGDIATWAAFDHLEHPEWKKADEQGDNHMHIFSNSLEGEIASLRPFIRKYRPEDFAKCQGNQAFHENAMVRSKTIYSYGNKEEKQALNIQQELYSCWGIKTKINEEIYQNIHLYNETTYREISKDWIYGWDNSPGHAGALKSLHAKNVGISAVNEYVYYTGSGETIYN